jgi:hypothetical protein
MNAEELVYYTTFNANSTLYNSTNNSTISLHNNTEIMNSYDIISNKNTGKYVMISGALGSYNSNWTLYTSNDYGQNLSKKVTTTFTNSWGLSNNFGSRVLSISDNGQYQYFLAIKGGSATIYHSGDYGNTFSPTILSQSGINIGFSIGTSSDGKYVVVSYAINGGSSYLRMSNDYGNTFNYLSLSSSNSRYYVFQGSRIYITTSGTSIITPNYIYNTVTNTQYNYSKNIGGSQIIFTNNDINNILLLSQNCSGYYINGSVELNSSYTLINNISSNCYAIDGITGFNKIYQTSISKLYESYDILQNYNIIRTIPSNTCSISVVGYIEEEELNPICYDENSYCLNPFYSYGILNCYYDDILNCAQGCINNICYNQCQNECNILGATLCSDSTTVSKCDDWNSDGCYEYRPTTICATGQFCLNSGNYFGSCVNTTQNGTHGVYGLSVIPYSTSDDNTSYNDNTATRTISVNTIFSAHTQDFYTTGTNYISRTCDYTEPVIYSTGYVNITSNNENIQTLTSASSQDTIIKLSLRPSDYSEGWITISDTLNSVNSKYYYQRNYTEKRMCLYDTSLNIIYCDYSTNSYDDLESLDFEYSFKFASKTYTTKVTFNRVVDNIQIIGAQTFLGANIYKSNITQYIVNESTIINQLVITNPTPYNTFSSNTGGTTIILVENPNCNCGALSCAELKLVNPSLYRQNCYVNQTIPVFVQSCIYTTSGNHLVRTYGNNNGVPDYSSYSDYNVNIVGLGLTSDEVANANPNSIINGGGMPQYMKYILVAITIMILFGVFLVIGYQTDNVKITTIFATVLSIFAVIVYTIIGWISAWIIIAVIVLSLAILIILGSMKTTATG